MSRTKHLKEGQVAAILDLAVLVTVVKGDVLDISLVEILLARPLESIGPSLVAKPVANEIGITSVDQDWDLLEDTWHKTVERLHPVSLEKEVSVNIKIAAVVATNFNTEFLLNRLFVQILANPAKSRVAEVVGILALTTDVVDILSGSLIRTNHSIVAVDTGRNARPNTLAIIAILDEALTARKSVLHSLAFTIIKNSWVTTLSTSHWLIVLVLSKAISKTVTNQDRLEVNVAFLVRQDLGIEDWDVVTSVRLASNVEVLLRIFGELFEEEGEKSIYVLASGNGIADRATAVGVPNVDWLI